MDFTVCILGSGSAIPTLQRGTSAHYVNCRQRSILIDCGEGTQIQMRKFNVKFQRLQLVLITHLHGDHIFGLPGLLGTMQLLGRSQPLTIAGPKGIQSFLVKMMDLPAYNNFFPLEFVELETNEKKIVFEDKCVIISCFPLKHRVTTFGYKIEEKPGKRHLNKMAFDATGVSFSYIEKLLSGKDIVDNNGVLVKWEEVTFPSSPTKSFAFCSDTAYFPEIVDAVQNVNLLYHEATFTEKHLKRAKTTRHSTAKQAATIAKDAGVKKLVLGHFSTRYKEMDTHLKEATSIFSNTVLAEDGKLIVVE